MFYVTAADRPQSRILRGLGKTVGPAIGAKYGGTLTAVDSRTNKIAWQKRMPYSIGQGSRRARDRERPRVPRRAGRQLPGL